MADFTTLGADFAVRANDGFHWALYRLQAESEKAAHAAAAVLWRTDQNKTAHADEPMPSEAPEFAPLIEQPIDTDIEKLRADLAAAQAEAADLRDKLTAAKDENADLQRSLEAATTPDSKPTPETAPKKDGETVSTVYPATPDSA